MSCRRPHILNWWMSVESSVILERISSCTWPSGEIQLSKYLLLFVWPNFSPARIRSSFGPIQSYNSILHLEGVNCLKNYVVFRSTELVVTYLGLHSEARHSVFQVRHFPVSENTMALFSHGNRAIFIIISIKKLGRKSVDRQPRRTSPLMAESGCEHKLGFCLRSNKWSDFPCCTGERWHQINCTLLSYPERQIVGRCAYILTSATVNIW